VYYFSTVIIGKLEYQIRGSANVTKLFGPTIPWTFGVLEMSI